MKSLAWLALWLGVASAWMPMPVWWWRAGWVAMAVHVLMAFGTVHGWSHGAAVEATARQVESVVGWRSGAGVWLNHAFMGAWMAAMLGWRRLGPGWRRAWWAAFVFMGFHASVVFVAWPARWLGLAWLAAAMVGLGRSWHGDGRGPVLPMAGPG